MMKIILLVSFLAMVLADVDQCGYMRVQTRDGGEEMVKYMPEDKYQKYCVDRYNPHLRNREDNGNRRGDDRESSLPCCPCSNARTTRFARVDDNEGTNRNCRQCREKCQGGRNGGGLRSYGDDQEEQPRRDSSFGGSNDDEESENNENVRRARSPRMFRSRRNNAY